MVNLANSSAKAKLLIDNILMGVYVYHIVKMPFFKYFKSSDFHNSECLEPVTPHIIFAPFHKYIEQMLGIFLGNCPTVSPALTAATENT